MRLKAKIAPEYLDEIVAGDKRNELRTIEDITLDDGSRSMTFKVKSITQYPLEEGLRLRHVLPGLLAGEPQDPVVLIELGKEVGKCKQAKR